MAGAPDLFPLIPKHSCHDIPVSKGTMATDHFAFANGNISPQSDIILHACWLASCARGMQTAGGDPTSAGHTKVHLTFPVPILRHANNGS